jgi:hypothetical protein
MGTATTVAIRGPNAEQFRGIFGDMRVVRFTVDVGSLNANTIDATTVSVPGLDPRLDVVIGWTHYHTGGHAHEYIESFHTWTDELHFIAHNTSGGAINPPSVDYTVVIGRLIV